MSIDWFDLSDNEIIARVNAADKYMTTFRESDMLMSKRYLNLSEQDVDTEDDEDWDDDYTIDDDGPDRLDIPIGKPNYIAINNEVKMAAIAMGVPKLHVKANEDPENGGIPNASDIVGKSWDISWANGNWKRETQSGLQKWGICGLAMLWYRWDSKFGPDFQHVPSKRYFIDPNATSLSRLDYAGIKIRLPLRKAYHIYDPDQKEKFFDDINLDDPDVNLDKKVVTITIYYDLKDEVHIYKDKVIFRDENRYKRIPLIPLLGYIDPRGKPMPIGDNIVAAGLNQQVVDLAQGISNIAKHSGSLTLLSANGFDPTVEEALKSGETQQFLKTKGPLNPANLPLVRVPGEQPSPAYSEARREAQMALDGIQGVTPGMRGEQVPGVTATQSVMVENRSGARPMQAKADYEEWITKMATAYIWLMQEFGGPTQDDPGTEETRNIWRAFKAVYQVQVIEGSSSYQNPAQDQQSTMQLFTTVMQSYELFLSVSQMGLVDKVPNLEQYVNDMLRAWSRQNIEQYWKPAPQPQENNEPNQDIIRALSTLYSKAPPDVKREIEAAMGIQPSQTGEEPTEDDNAEDPSLEVYKMKSEQNHDSEMQSMQHAHELRMELLKENFQKQLKLAEIGHQTRMAEVQAKQQKAQQKVQGGKNASK